MNEEECETCNWRYDNGYGKCPAHDKHEEDTCDKHGSEDCMECFYTTPPIAPTPLADSTSI